MNPIPTPKIFFKKTELLEAMAAAGDEAYCCTPTWYKLRNSSFCPKYGLFNSSDEFKTWYNRKLLLPIEKRLGVCEIIQPGKPAHLFADFDCAGLLQKEFLLEPICQFVSKTSSALRELHLVADDWKPQLVVANGSRFYPATDGTTKFKFSVHCVIQNVLFRNVMAMREFVRAKLAGIGCLDATVYRCSTTTSLNLLRLPGSAKWDDPTKTPLRIMQITDLTGEHLGRLQELCNLKPDPIWTDMLVSVNKRSPIAYDAVNVDIALPKNVVRAGTDQNSGKLAWDISEYSHADKITKMIKGIGFGGIVQYQGNNRFYLKRTSDSPTLCLARCKKDGQILTHSSNNAHMAVDEMGDVYVYCFSERCAGVCRLIGNIQDEQDTESVSWGTHANVIVLEDEPQVLPFTFEDKTKLLCIQAGMGMGKTYQIAKFLETENPNRVLMITSRVSLADTLHGRFGDRFNHYQDNAKGEWQIVQYESLHKTDMTAFDVVIVDEIRSMLSCVCNPITNHKYLEENGALFQWYLKNATKVIAVDADLTIDTAVSETLRWWFKPSYTIKVQIYRMNEMRRDWRFYDDDEVFNRDLTLDIQQGKKIAIACRTKKDSLVYERLCMDTSVDYRLYNAETDDEVKKDWKNPDIAFENCQVVIFTSTVTVGADVTIVFDRVYVDASSWGGCNAREINQMTGRFRALGDNVIRAHVQKGSMGPWRNTYQDQLELYKSRKLKLRRGINFELMQSGVNKVSWTPNWVMRVACCVQNEENHSMFGPQLRHLLFSKGCLMHFVRSVDSLEEKVVVSKKRREETKQVRDEENETLLNELYLRAFNEEDAAAIELKISNRSATHDEKRVLDVWKTIRWFDEQLSFDEFKVAATYRKQIRITAALVKKGITDINVHDRAMELKVKWVELSLVSLSPIFRTLSNVLLRLMGCPEDTNCEPYDVIKMACSSDNSWTHDSFAVNYNYVMESVREIRTARGLATASSSSACTEWKLAKSSLGNELLSTLRVSIVGKRTSVRYQKTWKYHLRMNPKILDLAKKSKFFES